MMTPEREKYEQEMRELVHRGFTRAATAPTFGTLDEKERERIALNHKLDLARLKELHQILEVLRRLT